MAFQFHGHITKMDFINARQSRWDSRTTNQGYFKVKNLLCKLFHAVHQRIMFVTWLSTIIILLPTAKTAEISVILRWLTKINIISCVNAGDWIELNIKTLALKLACWEKKLIISRKTVGECWGNPTNRVLPPWRIYLFPATR